LLVAHLDVAPDHVVDELAVVPDRREVERAPARRGTNPDRWNLAGVSVVAHVFNRSIKSTIAAAVLPSPYKGGCAAGRVDWGAAVTIFFASAPASTCQPASTVSTHSVSSRSVTHGTP